MKIYEGDLKQEKEDMAQRREEIIANLVYRANSFKRNWKYW